MPCTPLCPSQNRSGATSDGDGDPAVPNKRTVVPFANLADKPRHFSVYSIVPSGVNARSHGFCSPLTTVVRVSVGTSVDAGPAGGGAAGDGDGGGAGAGAGAGAASDEPPPHAMRPTVVAIEMEKNSAARFMMNSLS